MPTKSDKSARFSLTMENLGPIQAKGTVTPKKLTILTGPNNGGKTYAMYALWGLGGIKSHKFDLDLDIPENNIEDLTKNRHTVLHYDLFFDSEWSNIQEQISKFLSNRYGDILAYELETNLPKLTLEELDFEFYKKSMIEFAKIRNVREDIIHPGLPHVRFSEEGLRISIDNSFSFNQETETFTATKTVTFENDNGEEEEEEVNLEIELSDITQRINDSILASISETFEFESLFFPAERGGVILSYRDIIRFKSRNEMRPTMMGANYPEPIGDYINFLLYQPDLYERLVKARGNQKRELADFIEEKIAHVKYVAKEKEGLRFIPEDQKSENDSGLPIHIASSTVKNMFGLWLLLTSDGFSQRFRRVKTIMIDEPELSLHIHNQLMVARLIARMVNAGYHVYISTHSDNIIRELSTLIMLGSNRGRGVDKELDDLAKEKGYDTSEFLNIDDVVVYNFPGEGKSIEECTISTTQGIEVPKMNEAIDEMQFSLNNIALLLADREIAEVKSPAKSNASGKERKSKGKKSPSKG